MSDIEAGGQPKPRRGKHQRRDPDPERHRLLVENLGEGSGIYDRVGVSFGGRRQWLKDLLQQQVQSASIEK